MRRTHDILTKFISHCIDFALDLLNFMGEKNSQVVLLLLELIVTRVHAGILRLKPLSLLSMIADVPWYLEVIVIFVVLHVYLLVRDT